MEVDGSPASCDGPLREGSDLGGDACPESGRARSTESLQVPWDAVYESSRVSVTELDSKGRGMRAACSDALSPSRVISDVEVGAVSQAGARQDDNTYDSSCTGQALLLPKTMV